MPTASPSSERKPWWDAVSAENVLRIRHGLPPVQTIAGWVPRRERWLGRTRTEVASNLEKSGWGNTFRDPEDHDKSKYLERHYGMAYPTGLAVNRVRSAHAKSERTGREVGL